MGAPSREATRDDLRRYDFEVISTNLPGVWNKVPESTYGVVREGENELHPFRPVHTTNGG
jgi:hypothetical protein